MKYVRVKSKTDEYFFVKKFDLDSKKYFSGTFDNTFASISNNTITIYTPAFLLKDRGKIKKYVEKVSKVKLKSFYSDKNIIPLPKIKNIKELIYGYFWLIGWQNYYGSEGWKKYFSKFAKIIPEECKKTKPILYRGIKVSKENLSLLKKGKSLKLKNKIFSSWTDSEKIAKKFALGTIGPLAGKKKRKRGRNCYIKEYSKKRYSC